MRRKISLIFVFTIWTLVAIQWVHADSINITVTDMPSSEGKVMVQILAGEAQFKGESPAIASIMQQATTGEMQFSAHSLPAGEYAFRVMHDINNNDELDSNFVGMPTEPWAFSNNATGNFGPPKWENVKFQLDGTVNQTIKLNR